MPPYLLPLNNHQKIISCFSRGRRYGGIFFRFHSPGSYFVVNEPLTYNQKQNFNFLHFPRFAAKNDKKTHFLCLNFFFNRYSIEIWPRCHLYHTILLSNVTFTNLPQFLAILPKKHFLGTIFFIKTDFSQNLSVTSE